uniref:Uncharacterized protein n=1 Tax=Plectus sambesii TaxID=2011161 RepID=A0A914WXW0_9BILA
MSLRLDYSARRCLTSEEGGRGIENQAAIVRSYDGYEERAGDSRVLLGNVAALLIVADSWLTKIAYAVVGSEAALVAGSEAALVAKTGERPVERELMARGESAVLRVGTSSIAAPGAAATTGRARSTHVPHVTRVSAYGR